MCKKNQVVTQNHRRAETNKEYRHPLNHLSPETPIIVNDQIVCIELDHMIGSLVKANDWPMGLANPNRPSILAARAFQFAIEVGKGSNPRNDIGSLSQMWKSGDGNLAESGSHHASNVRDLWSAPEIRSITPLQQGIPQSGNCYQLYIMSYL